MIRLKIARLSLWVCFTFILLVGIAWPGDTETVHTGVWEAVSPSIVGINCELSQGGNLLNFYGTGAIIHENGLVLTITGVVPPKAKNITVFLSDGRRYKAQAVFTDENKEITLLDIGATNLPSLSFDDSEEIKVGETAYTFGNVLGSINNDYQVSLAVGVISGIYSLEKEGKYYLEKLTGKYKGEVIETTAAVNGGVDGGPLVSAKGKIRGLIILSYSKSRRLGIAIPSKVIKPLLAKYMEKSNPKDDLKLSSAPSFEHIFHKLSPYVVGLKVTYEQKPKTPDPTPLPREPGVVKPVPPDMMKELTDYSTRPDGLYSGVLIEPSNGYILTSYHNIDGKIREIKVIRQTDTDKKEYSAKVIGWCQDLDLALLKTEKGLPGFNLELNKGGNLKVGQWTVILGNNPDPTSANPVMTVGVVSALDRLVSGKAMQVDAGINYANLGAPIFDIDGNFIGMAGLFARPVEWGWNSGVGLAVEASAINGLIPDLKDGKKMEKTPVPFLGIQFSKGSFDEPGVIVDMVIDGAAADKAGIKKDDIILEFNGRAVNTWRDLINFIRDSKVDDNVKLKIKRKGEIIELEAMLGQRS
ncbi:MAG: trypsin-like peptidase domain-containing protein [Planctomycetes bacterium]|nr:trypsin-like peptidase domain-containing protein [Planctomycetota bacterium]